MKFIIKHYYKAKEFIKEAEKFESSSYDLSKHVMYTAYYALKHDIPESELDSYIDKVIEQTHKKLFSCGCQCYIDTPLGKHISTYEGGGAYIRCAETKFKDAVKTYYTDLCLYNESEEDGINDGE